MRSVGLFYAIATAVLWATNAVAMSPTGPQFREIGRTVTGLGEPAQSRFATGDVDGDGLEDLVFVGGIVEPVLYVFGKQGSSLGFKQATPLVDAKIVRILREPRSGTFYTLADDGKLRQYSGWPLQEQGTVSIVTAGATAAAIGDINGDHQLELVLCTADVVAVHSLAGNLLWSLPSSGGYDLALAQLDADPALEIVIANHPGFVIDGATKALDWQYSNSFGNYLAAGHIGSANETRFVANSTWDSFSVFGSTPWSLMWSYGPTAIVGALATFDLDGDGVDEILQGDYSSPNALHVIDSFTHLERFRISSPAQNIRAIAAADLDGDNVPEIAFATSYSFVSEFYGTTMFVADSGSGAFDWFSTDQYGPFAVAAVADVDGDGRAEQLMGADDTPSIGRMRIFDAASGQELWRTPYYPPFDDPLNMSPARILAGQFDTDAQQEIVLAGNSGNNGRVVILDGVSHAVQRQIGTDSGPMQYRRVIDALLMNYDNDGVLDIVVATAAAAPPAIGAKLYVFSGANGSQLWQSPAMGNGLSWIRGVLVGNVDADPQEELIAVLPDSLRAFDSQTQLQEWSLAATANGALLLPHGASSAELAVFNASGNVSIYNASTRGFLRSMSLPSPLNALVAPNGDAAFLLAAAGGKLHLVDSVAKSVLASSELLGSRLGEGNQLGAWQLGPDSWHIGAGGAVGIFRYRLDMSDLIFAQDFD